MPTKGPSRIELKAAIEAVKVEREKIKGAKTIEEALRIVDQDLETAKETLKDLNIEIDLNKDFFENVSIKLPKSVMDLLRYIEPLNEEAPEAAIEYFVVESIRAGIDAGTLLPQKEALTEKFNLDSVFKAVLD
jgi:hypothetical protein